MFVSPLNFGSSYSLHLILRIEPDANGRHPPPNGYVNRAAPEMLVVVAALVGAAPVEQMLGGLSAAISGVRSAAF